VFERDRIELHHFVSVTIPGRPPTPNESNRAIARQKAWRERREWRMTASGFAEAARLEWERRHGETWKPLDDVEISVAFGVKDNRRRDLDNLIASVKPLLDGLVDAGLIVDDSIAVIRRMEFGAVVNGRTETVIAIDEATNRE
jgi:Holliday junction resolvase RusA-like endonuclease